MELKQQRGLSCEGDDVEMEAWKRKMPGWPKVDSFDKSMKILQTSWVSTSQSNATVGVSWPIAAGSLCLLATRQRCMGVNQASCDIVRAGALKFILTL
jgi:hypothetical protein